MARKRTGFGRSNSRNGLGRQPATSESHSNLKKPQSDKKSELASAAAQPNGTARLVKIADIAVVGKRRKLNVIKVNELVATISILGLRTPITVRPRMWGEPEQPFVLIAGEHRLEAMKKLGAAEIACVVVEDDKRHARMWEISENLHRAELTPLERAAHVTEWLRLSQETPGIFGQNVQKKQRGRPKGGVAQAARHLPVEGKSEDAKRRTIERALKLDAIFAKAKREARKAGLDKNQSALLKIAAEKTLDGQLAQIRALGAAKSETNAGGRRNRSSSEDKQELRELMAAWTKPSEIKRRFSDASPIVRRRFCTAIQKEANKIDWA